MAIFMKKVINHIFATIFHDTDIDLAATFKYKLLIITILVVLSAVAIFTLAYFK